MKMSKTNAMRILELHKIKYEIKEYPHQNVALDGVTVAGLISMSVDTVYKTLVTVSNTKEYFVFMLPVNSELDLKKCAKIAGVKSLELIPVKSLLSVAGYIRGCCSPLGMKKDFKAFIYEECILFDEIAFSAGRLGMQIVMNPIELIKLRQMKTGDFIK